MDVVMNNKRVYVDVSGGVVQDVLVPVATDGTWTVIDWDNIEADPTGEWNKLDEHDKEYIRNNYPEECEKYFFRLV